MVSRATHRSSLSENITNFELFDPFKIVALICDTLAQSVQVSVHHTAELLRFYPLDGIVNCSLQILESVQVDSRDEGFQLGKNPVVWRAQIWRVSGVWNCLHVMLNKQAMHRSGSVRGRIVMQQSPGLVSPLHWSFSPHSFMKSEQNVSIDFSCDAMPIGYEFSMHDPVTVKEQHQHQFLA